MFDKGTEVRITKLDSTAAPVWVGVSIPKGYLVEGVLIVPIKPDGLLQCWRKRRTGDDGQVVDIEGYFRSSPIKGITQGTNGALRVETENSIYLVEKLGELDATA